MGMSTHVYGIRAPDDKWRQMKAVFDACVTAGVPIPPDVDKFFNGSDPDPAGVVVHIESKEHNAEAERGLEVELAKLPKDLTHVRFVNSW